MRHQVLQHFNAAQIEEIKRYKWIESEKRGYDIGFNQAAIEWIKLYSQTFREYWLHCYTKGGLNDY